MAKKNNVAAKRTSIYLRCLLTMATVSVALAAGPSFSGTWKLNMAKSQLTGQTATIEKTASGRMHFDGEGFGYDFDLTGKEYPTPDGGTTAWRAANPTTWDVTNRMKGKVTVTFRLSLAGDSMNTVVKLTKPDGSVTEQSGTMTRVSGGPGFLGKWKSTEVKGSPNSIVIATEGQNGITMTIPEGQAVCKGSFDGKDCLVSLAGEPSRQTLSFEKTGANAFKMTTKVNGKPFYIDVFTVSADGKTLTDEGNAVSVNEPIKGLYERQ